MNKEEEKEEYLNKCIKLIEQKIKTPRQYFKYALFWLDYEIRFDIEEGEKNSTILGMKNYTTEQFVQEYISDTSDWGLELFKQSYEQLLRLKSGVKK